MKIFKSESEECHSSGNKGHKIDFQMHNNSTDVVHDQTGVHMFSNMHPKKKTFNQLTDLKTTKTPLDKGRKKGKRKNNQNASTTYFSA